MPMYRWDELEEVPLNPLIKGRVVEVPNAMLAPALEFGQALRSALSNGQRRTRPRHV